MEHHPTLPPSSFPALQICSHFVSRGEGNSASRRGDRIHELTACLVMNARHLPTLDKEEEECAKWMADKTRQILEKVDAVSEGISIKDPLTGEEITHGTLDCRGRNYKGSLTIIDWKTGRLDDYDSQIMIYALGVMDKLEEDMALCVFVYGDQRKIAQMVVRKEDAEDVLCNTLMRQANTKEPYVKSKYCARCVLRPSCPAWVMAAGDALALAEGEALTESFREGLDTIVKDPVKLGRFLKGWKALTELVEDHDVRGAAIRFLEQGIEVGDYEVRERKGRKEYDTGSVQTLLHLIKDGDLDLDKAAAMFRLDASEVEQFFKEVNKPCPVNAHIKGTFKVLAEKNSH